MTPEERRKRADESVAASFSRPMNAATAPWGVACDLTVASAISAVPLVLLVRQAMGGALASPLTVVIAVVGIAPIAIAVGASIALRGAREKVVDWLAAQPFPIDNVNSLLLGISDDFEVVFEGPPPSRDELQPKLDRVSDDTLWTAASAEERRADIKIGVPDDKRLPLRANHLRYARFVRIVEEVLVPLHRERPIAHVRIV